MAKAGISKELAKLVADAAPGDSLDVIVRFTEWPAPEWRAGLAAHGVQVFEGLRTLPAYRATATVAGVKHLLSLPNVEYVEYNAPIQFNLQYATRETRARDVWDPLTAVGQQAIVVGGQVIDGTGYGVAVVDSGVDATHPDLPWGTKVVKNFYRTVPLGSGTVPDTAEFVDVPNSDLASGHGTHVAGTVAGLGVASDGLHMGAARGASLYGFGMGVGLNIFAPTDAFDFILRNQASFNPPIVAVTNSWSSCSHNEYDPNGTTEKLSEDLVAAGITVLFAMGNIDLDCPDPVGSGYAMNPTPGVIGVGNYDGSGSVNRDGTIDDSSSEGWPDNSSTWPDVAAPGTNIVAPLFYSRSYVSFSGTSMATPHVAGIVAMLHQAKPGISPAEVERVLEATAYPFDDDIDPVLGHYKKGHGLVDAFKALHAITGGLGVNDGVNAMSITQGGTTTSLTRLAPLGAAAGTLTVTGDVSFQPGGSRGYAGDVFVYQGGQVEPFVIVDIVHEGPRVAAAGEPVRLSARNVAANGDVPAALGLPTTFQVQNVETGALILSAASTVICPSDCRTNYDWTIPATTPLGLYRIWVNVTAGAETFNVGTRGLYIVGTPGAVPPLEEPTLPGVTGAMGGADKVEARFGGGAWVNATLSAGGRAWTVNVTVPTVVTNGALLEVRATKGTTVKTDTVAFLASPGLRVSGPTFVLVDTPITYTAAVDAPGFAVAWDADYDGVTFDVDGVGTVFNVTYATTGTKTVAARALDAGGNGAIRTFEGVSVVRPIVLVDQTKLVRAGAPLALATSEVGVRDPQATRYTFAVTPQVIAFEATLSWTHYLNPEDPLLGLTVNDFDLWFADPAGGYDHHGGATNHHGERAYVAEPAAGSWSVDVSPFLVAQEDSYRIVVTAYTL